MTSATPTPPHPPETARTTPVPRSGFCRLLKQHRDELLDPSHAEIPACLFLAIDDIEDARTREKTRTLFGDFVASLRGAVRGMDTAGVRARLDRLIAFLEPFPPDGTQPGPGSAAGSA